MATTTYQTACTATMPKTYLAGRPRLVLQPPQAQLRSLRALSNEAQRRCIVLPGQRSVIKCGAIGGDTNGKGSTPKKVARVAAVAAPAEPVMAGIRKMRASDLTLAAGQMTTIRKPDASLAESGRSATDYLKLILTSKVYDCAIETPLEEAPRLSERVGNSILLKREDLQPVFSFKLRGAYNCMASLTPEQLAAGVITASAGNHAQGVAMSASKLGCSAIVAMPKGTPSIKVDNVRRLGAHVELVGDTFDSTQAWAKQASLEQGRTFIPPFDHPNTIAGQGTIGMEIFNQCNSEKIHAVFVPVGGGGLISGVAAYIKALRPEVKIIGVEPAGANAMALSLQEGERVELAGVDTFADGVAVKQTGVECFRLCQHLVDGVVLVDTDSLCGAIKDVFEDTRSILEPAGALAVAGAKAYLQHHNLKGTTCVAITSGANMNFGTLRKVSELADIGTQTECLLASFIPDVKGSFKEFYTTIGPEMNITEFKYRFSGAGTAQILYSINVKKQQDVDHLLERLNAAKMKTVDLSNNDLVKQHLRHMTGGMACVTDEILFQFQFPERPGALDKFLGVVGTQWNISMFHYRFTGGRVGRVLVGIQMAESDLEKFCEEADSLKPDGFDYSVQPSPELQQFLC